MIKAISFDVWNTLVKPNPTFATERTKFIAQELSLPEEQVKASYTKVKRHVDGLAETNGLAFTTPLVYMSLVRELLGNRKGIKRQYLIDGVNDLFEQYPPVILDSTVEVVNEALIAGIKVGVASNSNFISGKTMHPFLEKSFSLKFDFAVYSDLSFYAKPAQNFFQLVLDGAGVDSTEMVHIGDSLICDGGSQKVGIKPIIIGGVDDLYNVVRGVIDAKK